MELMGVEVDSFYTLTCRSRRLQAVKNSSPRPAPAVSITTPIWITPSNTMDASSSSEGFALPPRRAQLTVAVAPVAFFSTGRGRSFCNKTPSEISCCAASARSVRAHKACNAGMPLKGTHRPEGGISGWAGLGKVRAWPAGPGGWRSAPLTTAAAASGRPGGRRDEEQDAAGQAGRQQPRRSSSIDMHTAQEGVASTTRRHSAIMNLTPPWSCVLLMQYS